MQRFLDLFICINCSTCFRRFLRPSSGAQNCTYSVIYCQTVMINKLLVIYVVFNFIITVVITSNLFNFIITVWQYLMMYVQFCAPDDGRRNRLRHVEQFIQINRSRKRCILLVVFRDILVVMFMMYFYTKLDIMPSSNVSSDIVIKFEYV